MKKCCKKSTGITGITGISTTVKCCKKSTGITGITGIRIKAFLSVKKITGITGITGKKQAIPAIPVKNRVLPIYIPLVILCA